MDSLGGNPVKDPPDCLLEYELCKTFGWTPKELYEQDEDIIDRFVTIYNAVNEFESKGSGATRRKELKSKLGGVNARPTAGG